MKLNLKNTLLFKCAGYALLIALLFCSFFWIECFYVAVGYTVLLSFFLFKNYKILGLILFADCFSVVFKVTDFGEKQIFLWNLLLLVLKAFVCLFYLLQLIKKEKKLNWKLLTPLLLFLLYMALPIHTYQPLTLLSVIFSYLSLYVAFEARKEIRFFYLARILVFSVVFMFIFVVCFGKDTQVLTDGSSLVSSYALLAIIALLVLRYKKEICISAFYLFFIPIFIFGYLTISSSFLLGVVVAIFTFALLYLINNKFQVKRLLFVFSLLLVVVGIVLILFSKTKVLFANFSLFNNGTVSDIFGTNVTGAELLKFFVVDWSSSVQTIFFGRGIATEAGLYNVFLQKLWEHGIIGYLFYITLFICAFNWKSVKKIFAKDLSAIVLLLPFVLLVSIELNQCIYLGTLLAIFVARNKENKNQVKLYKVDYNLLKDLTLSIIIPVYNGERFIKSCLDKVLQIKLKKEIIVINDGSQDNSLQLLREYGEQIRLINLETNKGVSHARNLGLEHATGDYITFIDIDDDFELDMHPKILTKMIKENADVGMCQYDDIDINGEKIFPSTGRKLCFEQLLQSEVVKLTLLNCLNSEVWTTVFKAELAKSSQFEEKVTIGEDRLYQLKIALKAVRTIFVQEDLYHYLHNPSATTFSSTFLQKVLDHKKLIDYLTSEEKLILNQHYKEEFKIFKLEIKVVSFDMVFRWLECNKQKDCKIINCLNKFLDVEVCDYVLSSKKFCLAYKSKYFLMKYCGIKFFVKIFPLLNQISGTFLKFILDV